MRMHNMGCSNQNEVLELLSKTKRINVFDIPTRLIENVEEMLKKNIIKTKLYRCDTEYNEHLSTYYIELK